MNCFKNNLRVHLHLLSSGVRPAVIYQLHGFKRDTTSVLPSVVLNLSLVMCHCTMLPLASQFPPVNVRDLQSNTFSLLEVRLRWYPGAVCSGRDLPLGTRNNYATYYLHITTSTMVFFTTLVESHPHD